MGSFSGEPLHHGRSSWDSMKVRPCVPPLQDISSSFESNGPGFPRRESFLLPGRSRTSPECTVDADRIHESKEKRLLSRMLGHITRLPSGFEATGPVSGFSSGKTKTQ